MFKIVLLVSLALVAFSDAKLAISGTNFLYNGQKVYLSGSNYGNDFGNGQYANSRGVLETWLTKISIAEGNSVRK